MGEGRLGWVRREDGLGERGMVDLAEGRLDWVRRREERWIWAREGWTG